MPPTEAVVKIGLEVQFFCTADPSDWDPLYGKSPVHLAGKLHSAALKRAVDAAVKTMKNGEIEDPGQPNP